MFARCIIIENNTQLLVEQYWNGPDNNVKDISSL